MNEKFYNEYVSAARSFYLVPDTKSLGVLRLMQAFFAPKLPHTMRR
jgi:hypothetical protein